MRKDRGFPVYLTEGTVSPVLAWKKPSIHSFPEALAFATRWSYSSEHSTWFCAPNEEDLCHKIMWTCYSVFMILQMRPNRLGTTTPTPIALALAQRMGICSQKGGSLHVLPSFWGPVLHRGLQFGPHRAVHVAATFLGKRDSLCTMTGCPIASPEINAFKYCKLFSGHLW